MSSVSELFIGSVSIAVFLVLLLLSRNYVFSFFITAAVCLCFLTGSAADGLICVFGDELYGQITDPAKAAMVAFIALYCGYVGTMEYGGAIKGFTRYFAERGKKTEGSVQRRAWFTSVGAFFSDLGSPGIVGTLFREKYNEVKLSRERLGLLINLTAVPVCSMIPLVGWGLFTIGIINNTVEVTGYEGRPISMFFHSIPFFCLSFLAILTPLLLQNKNFIVGRLKSHEKEARENSSRYLEERKPFEVVIDLAEEDGKGVTLLSSLAVMFTVLLLFLHIQGQSLLTADVFPFMIALGLAFVAAALTAILLVWIRGERNFSKSWSLYSRMFQRTVSVTGIMVVSWIFFDVIWKTELYQQLTEWLGEWMPAVLAFPLVFVIGAVLSSLTGSAWGTYAVVMPLGILLAQAMDLSVFAGIGVAVSGGVYGDISAKNSHAMHYSAESAGVDPEEFRRTQQPYMLLMGAACVLGYGFGALIDQWYGYMAIAVISYILLLLLSNRRMVKM